MSDYTTGEDDGPRSARIVMVYDDTGQVWVADGGSSTVPDGTVTVKFVTDKGIAPALGG